MSKKTEKQEKKIFEKIVDDSIQVFNALSNIKRICDLRGISFKNVCNVLIKYDIVSDNFNRIFSDHSQANTDMFLIIIKGLDLGNLTRNALKSLLDKKSKVLDILEIEAIDEANANSIKEELGKL